MIPKPTATAMAAYLRVAVRKAVIRASWFLSVVMKRAEAIAKPGLRPSVRSATRRWRTAILAQGFMGDHRCTPLFWVDAGLEMSSWRRAVW